MFKTDQQENTYFHEKDINLTHFKLQLRLRQEDWYNKFWNKPSRKTRTKSHNVTRYVDSASHDVPVQNINADQ